MIDRKKVKKGLKCCPSLPFDLCFSECTNSDCPYYGEFGIKKLHQDAITLLKEQEARIKKFELEKGWDESPDMMGKW